MKKLLAATLLAAGFATPALSADMAVKARPIASPAYNWTGWYGGVNAGGDWSRTDATTNTIFSPVGYFAQTSVTAIQAPGVGDQRINTSGFTAGLTGGYNWQLNSAVVGIESDFNYYGGQKSVTATAVYPCCGPSTFTVNQSVSTNWLWTLRGRAGFLVTPALLLYGTGGLAMGNIKASETLTDTFATASESLSSSTVKTGWTAGAGGEYSLMNGWSVKAEYLYVDLGRVTAQGNNLTAFTPLVAFPSNTFTQSVHMYSNIARLGLNYKFGG